MKNSKKTILIYGLEGMSLMNLAMNAKRAGIELRPVSDGELGYSVHELLSGKELPPSESLHINGRYALLDGFEGRLSEASSIINAACPGVIKAVHTEHNDRWPFSQLCYAIQQEENALGKYRKK